MNDYIVRATAGNAQIRAFAAVTTNLVEEAREHHGTSPVATAALGRLLTGGVMMGSMMKNDTDMLTIQIQCSGQIEGLTVTADSKGNVKGYAFNPDVMLPAKNGKLDVGGALGQGVMTIIKDMGLKEPYSGQTILQTGEIAEDLTYYFATSEQVPSSVGLGVLMNKDNTVKCAGGFIVQVMPFIEDEVLNKLEANIQKIQSVTSMLDNGHTPEQMLEQVLEGLDLEITDTMPAQFYCNCSKKRIEKAIISIGKKEIQDEDITGELGEFLKERKTRNAKAGEKRYVPIVSVSEPYKQEVISPILCAGDVIGAVFLLNQERTDRFKDTELCLAEYTAKVLGKQMEQ